MYLRVFSTVLIFFTIYIHTFIYIYDVCTCRVARSIHMCLRLVRRLAVARTIITSVSQLFIYLSENTYQ